MNFDGLFSNFGELTTTGLTQGAIYALVALGYTLVYGVLQTHQLRPLRGLHRRRVRRHLDLERLRPRPELPGQRARLDPVLPAGRDDRRGHRLGRHGAP